MSKYVLVLVGLFFSASVFAHCDPKQVAGVWNVSANNGNVSTAGFARFYPDGTVSVDAVGSAGGSDPSGFNIPRSHYVMEWLPVLHVFSSGLCQITATYIHDGITEKYWLVYQGGKVPNTLNGGDAVVVSRSHENMDQTTGQTLHLTLTRRVELIANN